MNFSPSPQEIAMNIASIEAEDPIVIDPKQGSDWKTGKILNARMYVIAPETPPSMYVLISCLPLKYCKNNFEPRCNHIRLNSR